MLTGLCAHVKRAAWSRKNLVLRLGTQSYLSGLLTRVSLCAVDSRIATAARAHPSRPTFEPEGPHSRKLGSSYPSCYKLGAAGSDSPVGRTRGGVEVGCFFVCGGGEKSSKGRGTRYRVSRFENTIETRPPPATKFSNASKNQRPAGATSSAESQPSGCGRGASGAACGRICLA